MKKAISIIAFASLLSVQVNASIVLTPVSIDKMLTVTHELGRGVNRLGPSLAGEPEPSGGGSAARNTPGGSSNFARNAATAAAAAGAVNSVVKGMTGHDTIASASRSAGRALENMGTTHSGQARAARDAQNRAATEANNSSSSSSNSSSGGSFFGGWF